MRKTYDHLWMRLSSFENLWTAYKKAARGKRSKPSVASFEYDLEFEDIATDETLKLGTQSGTVNYEVVAYYLPSSSIQAFEQFPDAIQALISGDVDAVIIDEVASQGYLGYGAELLKLVGPSIATDQLGFIFPQGVTWLSLLI